jgi:hypothetical protein
VPSGRQQFRDRHIAALDLVQAWIHDEDADLSNIADELAREPQAACYALARIMATATEPLVRSASIGRSAGTTVTPWLT